MADPTSDRTVRLRRLVAEHVCTVDEARRYALSQDISGLVVGIDSMEVLKQDLAMAPRAFQPLGKKEMDRLLAKVRPVAGDGRHECFQSTQFFDGPHHQRQHGLTKEQVKGTWDPEDDHAGSPGPADAFAAKWGSDVRRAGPIRPANASRERLSRRLGGPILRRAP